MRGHLRFISEEGEADAEEELDGGNDGFGDDAREAAVQVAGQPDGVERNARIPAALWRRHQLHYLLL